MRTNLFKVFSIVCLMPLLLGLFPSRGSAAVDSAQNAAVAPTDFRQLSLAGRIAFTFYRDGNDEIYVMYSDGTYYGRLTYNGSDDYNPTWVSGDWIAPIVATSDATSITTNSAWLNGQLTYLGSASTVKVSFQWGTSPGKGNRSRHRLWC